MAAIGGPAFDDGRRREMAAAFQDGGEHYDKVRPGYPADSVDWLFGQAPAGSRSPVLDVVDIGAGTGKFTERLMLPGRRVVALDPSADMLAQLELRFPEVHTIVGTAEATGLPSGSQDAATVAQAWHWCDPVAASTEIARILRPGGMLGLIWNQLDVAVPWVHRLSRIMHAGDVHKPGFRPAIGAEFTAVESHGTHWSQELTGEDIKELVKSRSYWLKANEATRAKVTANLDWYLYEHLGHTPEQQLALPYLTHTWRAVKAA
ncbi:class I SAM-dependent methyltransferase [Arthrobacter sp. 35W]|uniref:class I SAM-dependent methyltransferase n=1 Tax=Arthrobacter sp. 35W TaxID=1132441 RepID=UPI00040C21AF|nr:class I SAM-dependent methyltransferase [Arthrobacter sp. 35W]